MKIEELKVNKKNPRKMTQKQKLALKKSLEEFGDLGAIIYNEQTKRLVGGHQRRDALKGATIKIINKYDEPTKTGTIADGFAIVDGEKFGYRVVRWDEKRETEALLAANKHQGSWDEDLLKVMFNDIPNLDLELAGFELPELQRIGVNLPKIEISDEQYVRETPKVTEEIPVENPSQNVVEKTEEKAMNVVGRRFIIIIDCTSQEHKDALKEKIQAYVVEAGGKFF